MFVSAICIAIADSMDIMNEMKYEKDGEGNRLKNRHIDLLRRTSMLMVRMRNSQSGSALLQSSVATL